MANKSFTSKKWGAEFSKTGWDIFEGVEHIASIKQTANAGSAEDNARLIVSAPEMFETLLLLRDRINQINGFVGKMSGCDVFKIMYGKNELNNIIEKVKGGSI